MGVSFLINRQDEFSKADVLKSVVSAIVVFGIIVYATRKNVCISFEATKSLIFAYIMGCFWIGFCNTVSVWSQESKHILPRIKTRLFGVNTYLASVYISQTIICLLQAIVATFIFTYFNYERSGLVFTYSNMDLFITFWLVIQSAMTLGMFVGLLVKDIKGAMIVLPVILIAQMLFSKAIFEIEGFMESVSAYVAARFGVCAVGSILNINIYPMALKMQYPVIEQIPNSLFKYSQNYVLECWIHLLILTIIPMVLSYIVLTFKAYRKQ